MDKAALLRALVVCRGSSENGLGHVMRARTVAARLARRLDVHLVALGDRTVLTPLLANRGLSFEVGDQPELVLAAHGRFQPHIAVYDATDLPEAIFFAVKPHVLSVSLSPIFNCQEHVDLVFHRTRELGGCSQLPSPPPCNNSHPCNGLVGGGEGLGVRGARPGPTLRCGLEYAVLRESCQRIPEDVYRQNLERQPLAAAVSMGGADAGNNTLRLVTSISRLPNPLLLWVLLGEGYAHSYQALVDCVSRDVRHEIILAKTTDSIWRVLQSCSLAILAGGITTYEAAFAGLPSINVLSRQGGGFLIQELVDRGVCLSAGFPLAAALPAINLELARLEQARHELLQMHCRSQGLLDGQGAQRIAREIEAFYHDTRSHKLPACVLGADKLAACRYER